MNSGAMNSDAVNSCSIVDLGLIGWTEAFALQQRLVAARKARTIGDTLLVCQHPHTITLGRNAKLQHLLASESVLRTSKPRHRNAISARPTNVRRR